MWCDHLFSQTNRTAERTVGVGGGCNREMRGEWTKVEEQQVDNMEWDFIKQ